jgi:ABC-2 type transport system permease protein
MTTTTLTRPITAPPVVHASRLSFSGILRSEWIKALSLRSVRWSIATSIVAGLAMSLAMSFALRALMDEDLIGSYAEYLITVTGFPANLLSLVFGVLGVFLFSSEYASGMILSTLTAAPRRGQLMAAKAVVLTVISVVIAAVVVISGAAIAVAVMPESASAVWTLQTLTSLLGTTLFLVAIALFSFALAGILRSTAGAITVVVGVAFLLPNILQIVTQLSNWAWVQQVWNYLPTSLGMTLGTGIVESAPVMDAAVRFPGYAEALVALAVWVIVPMAIAARAFFARDAK